MLKEIYRKYLKPFERKIDTLNRIEISREAILHNYDLYQKLNPGKYILPTLKSNAYGHGLEEIASILKDRDPDYLAVDSYYEALRLKNIGKFNILLIGYTKPQNYQYFSFKNLAITVFDRETIKVLGQLKKKINIHLKIDTGMHRQGILMKDLKDYLSLIKKYQTLNLEGVMTHLADADGVDFSYTQKQYDQFKRALEIIKQHGFEPKYKHLANSPGGLKVKDEVLNAVRLGLGLYGYHCLEKEDKYFNQAEELKPSLRFISTIICVKELEKGDKVSYNCTFEAPSKMKIGVLPVGYYEGVNRRLSNKGVFSIDKKNLSIVGRVCMNLTCVDLQEHNLKVGDEIVIIDDHKNTQNSVINMAKQAETIPYVVTTKLSESIRRIIV